MLFKRSVRIGSALFFTLLAIEFLDEFAQGVRVVATPLIRDDLHLTYAQIGILIGLPVVVGTLIDPVLGILGDTHRRRRLILLGGMGVMVELVIFAISQRFEPLLLALLILSPASGAFVNLSQATLMDIDPTRHEQNMARWSFAGALGWVLGTLAISLAIGIGFGWRGTYIAMAVFAGFTVLSLMRQHLPTTAVHEAAESLATMAREAVRAAKQREVVHWLILLPFSDLMLDVLHGYLALYFVDVAGTDAATAGIAVLVWTGVGLLGDFLVIPLLERIPGLTYLRYSALIEFVLFTAFLLAPGLPLKLALLALLGIFNAGWYAVLQGQLYSALPGRSGAAISLSSIAGLVGGVLPLMIGLAAEQFGLSAAIWLLLAGPLALLIGLPRRA